MQPSKNTVAIGLFGLVLMPLITNAATVDDAIEQGVRRVEGARANEAKIANLDNETRSLESEYRAVIKESDGLKVYITQLERQLQGQQDELSNIQKSIEQVTLIERQIVPLMLKMIDSLEQFIRADLPFEQADRLSRVTGLRDLIGRSDVTVAEKYRKVMDAYQKEMNYGRTIKTFRGSLQVGNSTREVDFLRAGRVALLYRSLDGEEMGVWNATSGKWEPLGMEYKSKLSQALRIAREQAAPDLIRVPVAAPVAAAKAK